MRKFSTSALLAVVLLLLFSGLAFADTIHLKNGDKIENAKVTEITQTDMKYKVGQREVVYTISKDDVQKVVYNDGQEDVFAVVEEPEPKQEVEASSTKTEPNALESASILHIVDFGFAGASYVIGKKFGKRESFVFGLGVGAERAEPNQDGDNANGNAIALILLLRYDFLDLNGKKLFLGSKLGLGKYSFLNPFAGILLKKWSFALGSAFGDGEYLPVTLKAAYQFETEVKKKEAGSSRFFRPGIELNYAFWHSEIEPFDNPSTYPGGGVFFRIGPEPFYFATGIYLNYEEYKNQLTTSDLANAFGLSIPSIIDKLLFDKPLLEFKRVHLAAQLPLLLNFSFGQIRLSGGALIQLDMNEYFINDYMISDSEGTDWTDFISLSGIDNDDAGEMKNKFKLDESVNMHLVLGLDFDITKHFGIGAKCLIWGNSLLGSEPLIDPPRFQTRVSTYFVF